MPYLLAPPKAPSNQHSAPKSCPPPPPACPQLGNTSPRQPPDKLVKHILNEEGKAAHETPGVGAESTGFPTYSPAFEPQGFSFSIAFPAGLQDTGWPSRAQH